MAHCPQSGLLAKQRVSHGPVSCFSPCLMTSRILHDSIATKVKNIFISMGCLNKAFLRFGEHMCLTQCLESCASHHSAGLVSLCVGMPDRMKPWQPQNCSSYKQWEFLRQNFPPYPSRTRIRRLSVQSPSCCSQLAHAKGWRIPRGKVAGWKQSREKELMLRRTGYWTLVWWDGCHTHSCAYMVSPLSQRQVGL